MLDVMHILQAFLAPSLFVSAAALLLMSLNARLMGIVSRLRQLHREGHQATLAGRKEEAQAFADQIKYVEGRAEMVRRAFLSTLLCLGGTIVTCFLLAAGLYWRAAQMLGLVCFVASMLALLVGIRYYISEVLVALSAVREEARLFRLVLAAHTDRSEERRRQSDHHTGM